MEIAPFQKISTHRKFGEITVFYAVFGVYAQMPKNVKTSNNLHDKFPGVLEVIIMKLNYIFAPLLLCFVLREGELQISLQFFF